MSSSSSLRTFQSDGQQATIDAKNSDKHNSCSNDRSESCPADLIRDPAAYKIILDRGIMDGLYMRMSIPQKLNFVDPSNETVEDVAMIDVTNSAIIADLALASWSIATEAVNLAIESASVSTEIGTAKIMLNVALDAVEETKILANLARSMSRRNSRSHDGHGLHG